MPDWFNHLTKAERARVEKIDAGLSALQTERRLLMNRAKVRKHRQAN